MALSLVLCLCLLFLTCRGQGDDEIRQISSEIWDAGDDCRFVGNDLQYDINGPPLFIYVNESRFVGTYLAAIDLFDNYVPDASIEETCGQHCRDEEDVFLDAILPTQAIQLLHAWLVDQGLADPAEANFKEELRQYWFLPYTRSGGPLGSSGFEHVFVGEIDDGEVKGMHNWIQFYFEEKAADFIYGPYQTTCYPEIIRFEFNWLGYNKPITSTYMRTCPEVEIGLATLCLLARMGDSCPIRLDGVESTMTAWDMSGYPTTIGTAYPNC